MHSVKWFFLGIKYHFFGGYSNYRVEDLLLLLHGNITDFYDYMDQLAQNGRLKNLRALNDEKGKKIAENMLMAGMDKLIVWMTPTECKVPSQTVPDKSYNVDIVNVFCNCPAATNGGMCKHIHLSLLVASSRNIDLEKEKMDQVDKIINNEQYFYDKENNQLEVISLSGLPSIVNLESFTCSCFASSHGINCVCSIFARRIKPSSNFSHDNNLVSDDSSNNVQENIESKILNKFHEIEAYICDEKLQAMSENNKKSILQSLNQIYIKCCTSKFVKKSKKRKQIPLFPNRTCKKQKTYHSYNTSRKEVCRKVNVKLNEDGSFKMTGRRKGTLRKTFQ